MKINPKTLLSIVIAGISGVITFCSSISDQKKDELIKDMDKRIKVLENKGSN